MRLEGWARLHPSLPIKSRRLLSGNRDGASRLLRMRRLGLSGVRLKRRLLTIAGIGAVAVVALQAFAWQPAIPPIAPPPVSSFAADLVSRGEMLAEAGNCVACHT